MRKSLVTPIISAIPPTVPFVGAEALERERGKPFAVRIGANESVFGPSPKAIAVMREAVAETWMYADPESYDLRTALAAANGVGIENIAVGPGIDGLLGLTVRLTLEPGDPVVMPLGGYPTFAFHVTAQGGRFIDVAYRNDRADLPAMLDAATRENAKLLYLANPDNPMGSWWQAAEIEAIVARLPAGTMFLLDEAYSDTAPAGTLPNIDVANPQVLRFRTFSKAYGLAGARVGYVIGAAEIIAEFEKVRDHYGMNRVAQAGALAAFKDQAYLTEVVGKIAAARRRISEIARGNGLTALPSATNFVAIDCGADGNFARAVLSEILGRDIFARMPGKPPLDRCIRVSAGTPENLDLFAYVLPLALAGARKM